MLTLHSHTISDTDIIRCTGVATPELYPSLWNKLVKDFGSQRVKSGVYSKIEVVSGLYPEIHQLMLKKQGTFF